MNIKHIKKIIIHTLKRIPEFLKETKSLPDFWLYIALAVLLTGFFMILTFPYEVLVRSQLQQMGESFGGGAYVGNIDIGLFGDSTINNMTLSRKDGAELEFKNINFNIGHLRALISKDINGDLSVEQMSYSNEKMSIKGNIESDLNMEFNSFSDYPVKGKIDTQFKNVSVNGVVIKGFDIPPVKFTTIKIEAVIMKGRVKIEKSNFSGPDINGSITGYIVLSGFFKRSQIDLNIEIDSSSALLDNYKILLGSLPNENGKIKINLKGTLDNPKIDIPGTSSRPDSANEN